MHKTRLLDNGAFVCMVVLVNVRVGRVFVPREEPTRRKKSLTRERLMHTVYENWQEAGTCLGPEVVAFQSLSLRPWIGDLRFVTTVTRRRRPHSSAYRPTEVRPLELRMYRYILVVVYLIVYRDTKALQQTNQCSMEYLRKPLLFFSVWILECCCTLHCLAHCGPNCWRWSLSLPKFIA